LVLAACAPDESNQGTESDADVPHLRGMSPLSKSERPL
jgi:hypothetical protein